jgi:hypothetical protein
MGIPYGGVGADAAAVHTPTVVHQVGKDGRAVVVAIFTLVVDECWTWCVPSLLTRLIAHGRVESEPEILATTRKHLPQVCFVTDAAPHLVTPPPPPLHARTAGRTGRCTWMDARAGPTQIQPPNHPTSATPPTAQCLGCGTGLVLNQYGLARIGSHHRFDLTPPYVRFNNTTLGRVFSYQWLFCVGLATLQVSIWY